MIIMRIYVIIDTAVDLTLRSFALLASQESSEGVAYAPVARLSRMLHIRLHHLPPRKQPCLHALLLTTLEHATYHLERLRTKQAIDISTRLATYESAR